MIQKLIRKIRIVPVIQIVVQVAQVVLVIVLVRVVLAVAAAVLAAQKIQIHQIQMKNPSFFTAVKIVHTFISITDIHEYYRLWFLILR